MTADRDDLAAILDAHEFIPAYHGAISGRCKACHPPELDNMMGTNVHRAHVAQMVLESDWLRGVRDENKQALDLMRSLSINPTIPEGIRTLMKETLDHV